MTKIVKCTCKNDWQDKKYGNGMRVHNTTSKPNGVRCTVCKNDKTSTI